MLTKLLSKKHSRETNRRFFNTTNEHAEEGFAFIMSLRFVDRLCNRLHLIESGISGWYLSEMFHYDAATVVHRGVAFVAFGHIFRCMLWSPLPLLFSAPPFPTTIPLMEHDSSLHSFRLGSDVGSFENMLVADHNHQTAGGWQRKALLWKVVSLRNAHIHHRHKELKRDSHEEGCLRLISGLFSGFNARISCCLQQGFFFWEHRTL